MPRWPARALAAGFAAVLAGGCDSPYNYLRPAGRDAESLAAMGWFLVALTSAITLVLALLVLRGALRRRGTLAEHLPPDVGGGTRWILVGGVLVPGLVAIGLFLLTMTSLPERRGGAGEADLEVEVTAHQWWWEIRYRGSDPTEHFPTANELHVPVGRRVRISLRSADVIHSFWVPRLHGKVDMIPGHTTHLILQANAPGAYWGECAEYCGMQHSHMRFQVIAEPEDEFRAWAERQRRPAPVPGSEVLRHGRAAFEQYACALCHRIRGTEARGGVAPDLTHVGSRRTLAAGTLPNTRARLQAWIVNAQALKPGVRMPTLDQFDGETLNALASYLESLR